MTQGLRTTRAAIGSIAGSLAPREDNRPNMRGALTVEQARDAAEIHNGTMEAVFTTASQGTSEYTAKLMEFLKANTTSTLDFGQELFGVKTPAEAMELWTTHSRKSFETFSAQAKELAEFGQKVATETVEPIKTSASKYYKPAA
jgi:phasin